MASQGLDGERNRFAVCIAQDILGPILQRTFQFHLFVSHIAFSWQFRDTPRKTRYSEYGKNELRTLVFGFKRVFFWDTMDTKATFGVPSGCHTDIQRQQGNGILRKFSCSVNIQFSFSHRVLKPSAKFLPVHESLAH